MFATTAFMNMAVLILASLPLGTPPPQDEEEGKMTLIQDDMEFAVDLARYRYFDLADEYVTKIRKGHLSEDEKDLLKLTNASILKLASEHAPDDNERLTFYEKAVEEFKGFVEYSHHHPRFDEARMDLAETQINLARFLAERMKTVSDPEKRLELKKEAEENFKQGIYLYNEVERTFSDNAEALHESGEEDLARESRIKAQQTKYRLGVAYYFNALIYGGEDFTDEVNREDYLRRTISTLDDYIWDAGENDFYVLWAYIYQAMAYLEQENFSDALDLATQVYDKESGVDLDRATEIAPEYARIITEIAEEAYFQVARIYNRMGEHEKVDATVEEMVNEFGSRNLALDIKGSLARLEQAKALIAMDSTDKAAMICKEVGDANPSNIVGREAKIILKEIIDNASSGAGGGEGGLTISPDVLFSAAEGARLEQNYNDAIKAYMKVLATAKTVQLKNEFNARTWNAIGECYSKNGRLLEAAVAHEIGYTDPDRGSNQEIYEINAMKWYQALSNRHKETRAPFDEKRKKAAREKLVQLKVKTDLRFIIAQDKFNKGLTLQEKEAREKTLEEAFNEFKELEKTSDLYERSLVFRARCYFEMGKYEEAIKEYDNLLAELKKAGTTGTPEKRRNRKVALAEEAYWRAETQVKMEDHEGVLKTLDSFESKHKAQVDFFPAVVYNRMLARLGKGEFDKAEALYKELQEKHQGSVRAASAAYYMGLALINQALAVRGEPDTPASEEYKSFLKKGTEYMFKYCEQSNFDSFTNFKNVCEWYKELGLLGEEGYLETAREAYMQLLKVFKDDAKYKEEIESDVYRGYGEVLLALKDFQAAKPLWLKLLSQNTKNVGILRSTANCLGGWIESDGMTFIEVPGAGMYAPDPELLREANKIYLDSALGIWQYLLRGIDDAGNKYSNEWWEAKFYIVYNCYRAGQQYPSYYERTQQIIDNQRLFQPEMGGLEWSKRFRYVEKAMKRK